MDLQKIKEALELANKYINDGSPLPHDRNDPYFITSDAVEQALAELEKPVDDNADKVASRIEEIQLLLNDGSVMNKRHEKTAALIQQYAGLYHVKRCVWCKRNH